MPEENKLYEGIDKIIEEKDRAIGKLVVMLKRFVTYYEPFETKPEAIFKIENAKELISKYEANERQD